MTIWTPTTVGAMALPHRLAMAPMTRGRSRADGVPSALNVEYYRQRASMALITGIRLSPGNPFNEIVENDTDDLYPTLVSALAPLDLAYLHLIHGGSDDLLRQLRQAWPTALIVNRPGADLDTRTADLDAGIADIITLGTMALANPDLPARLASRHSAQPGRPHHVLRWRSPRLHRLPDPRRIDRRIEHHR